MHYLLGILGVILLVYLPSLWVKYVMWSHSKTLSSMPGTGGELAQHLVARFELDPVTVVEGSEGADHYNPVDQQISLSPSIYRGKSLTAVAVATHEVGHAIQFIRREPVSFLREKYLAKAVRIRQIGSMFLVGIPVMAMMLKSPLFFFLAAAIGVLTMLASVAMYVAILPEEFDASFKKALPILAEGYVPKNALPAVRQVLSAAALTYVAAALTDIVKLWRWVRIIR